MTDLYYRIRGSGKPLVVLHGGPDFNHRYLLPELDCLAESLQLILYDQRGRGLSPGEASEITIESELDDFVGLLDHLGIRSAVVAGHSWGALLAVEFALRVPNRISRLVLMNSAPMVHEDWQLFRSRLRSLRGSDTERILEISNSNAYKSGEPDAIQSINRLHFRSNFRDDRYLDLLLPRLTEDFPPAGIVKARLIGERLADLTWRREDYDLRPGLAKLDAPTLVIHGDRDFIPVEIARRLAVSIPNATERIYEDCGHFPYLERPREFCRDVTTFALG